MLKNAIIFRIPQSWTAPDAGVLNEALEKRKFVPCGPTQKESWGWVEPRGQEHGLLAENVGGQIIMHLKVQTKSVPSSAVEEALEERVKAIEASTGRKPGKKEKRELKEEIVLDLLPRAFTKSGVTTVWLDPVNRVLVVGAGSFAAADRVISSLIETLQETGSVFAVRHLSTQTSPGAAMSVWLATQDAPPNFSVDRECELKAADESKSVVKYSHHTLDIAEVVEHIKHGKMATKLALTWNDHVSFILTDSLVIKKITIHDVVSTEHASASDGKDDHFDADVAITTGELSKLIPDLLFALGGEVEEEMRDGVVVSEHPDSKKSESTTQAGPAGANRSDDAMNGAEQDASIDQREALVAET